jgi:phosphatidylserine/phosphatidylglycerophosphate/cardiolipin synthase-like enzyme
MRIPSVSRRAAVLLAVLLAVLVVLGACSEFPADFPGPGVQTQVVEWATAAAQDTPAADLPATAEADVSDPSATEGQAAAIEVFFTGNASRAHAVEAALVAALDGASQSVDMAMYNFSLNAVGEAILAAHSRGVRVRIVAESDALDGSWFTKFRKVGIKVQGDGREALMHNKFLVLDGREVWTGSLNLTQSGAYGDDNNYVRLLSTELAQRYEAIFEAMFTAGEFGSDRSASTWDPALEVDGVQMEVYFSPEDHPEKRLVELVRGARKSVRVLAYSFTSDALAAALRKQADAGLTIQCVFDESQVDGQGTEYAPLRQGGLDVRLDGNAGLMHNKVLIIDDEIVVLGSYNFTRAANQSNDENLIVVYDAALAGQYQKVFERIYKAGR